MTRLQKLFDSSVYEAQGEPLSSNERKFAETARAVLREPSAKTLAKMWRKFESVLQEGLLSGGTARLLPATLSLLRHTKGNRETQQAALLLAAQALFFCQSNSFYERVGFKALMCKARQVSANDPLMAATFVGQFTRYYAKDPIKGETAAQFVLSLVPRLTFSCGTGTAKVGEELRAAAGSLFNLATMPGLGRLTEHRLMEAWLPLRRKWLAEGIGQKLVGRDAAKDSPIDWVATDLLSLGVAHYFAAKGDVETNLRSHGILATQCLLEQLNDADSIPGLHPNRIRRAYESVLHSHGVGDEKCSLSATRAVRAERKLSLLPPRERQRLNLPVVEPATIIRGDSKVRGSSDEAGATRPQEQDPHLTPVTQKKIVRRGREP